MSSPLTVKDEHSESVSATDRSEAKSNRPPKPPRSPWRQRLAEAERGITQCFRGDSTLFVHAFIGIVILLTAMVLGISLVEWGLVILSLTVGLCSELYYQVLTALWKGVGHHFDETAQNTIRLATAAVLVAMGGASLVIAIIFISQIVSLFTG